MKTYPFDPLLLLPLFILKSLAILSNHPGNSCLDSVINSIKSLVKLRFLSLKNEVAKPLESIKIFE